MGPAQNLLKAVEMKHIGQKKQGATRPVHFRKCHVCSHLNEASSPILRCSGCNKALSPFFYFDEKAIRPASDLQLRPLPLKGEYSPIQGLTVYWESF